MQPAGDGAPKLPLSVSGNTITLNGQLHEVKPHQAAWVQLLIEAHGEGRIVPGHEFTSLAGSYGKKVSREFGTLKKLIPGLAEIIKADSGPSGGYYLKN